MSEQNIVLTGVPRKTQPGRLEACLSRAEQILTSAPVKDGHVELPVHEYRTAVRALGEAFSMSGGLA